jgi:hypothetical protein
MIRGLKVAGPVPRARTVSPFQWKRKPSSSGASARPLDGWNERGFDE